MRTIITVSRVVAAATALLAIAAMVLAGCAAPGFSDRPAPRVPTTPAPTRADVSYAPVSRAETLDFWAPVSVGAPAPLVVFFHGGGFSGGDNDAVEGKVGSLLDAGYAVASVNYRLSGEARFPAAARDAKAAVRFLRATASSLGVDPGRFVAWGESAGANLAALLGVTGDQRTVLDDPSLGNGGVSGAVQAVVDWYGPIDFTARETQARAPGSECRSPQLVEADRYTTGYLGAPVETVPRLAAEANPVSYVATAGRLPAFSIAHGSADCLVPVAQSRTFATALTAAGNRPDVTILDGAGHADRRFDSELLAPTIRRLDAVLAR